MPQIAVIVARQRSGTTVLRRMLNTDPNIRELGEVFSSRHSLGAHRFLRQRAMDEAFSFRQADMNLVFDDLFDHLYRTYQEDVLFLDAKYNSMGPFNGYGWKITSEPQFLGYCRKHGVPIIHLIRRDVFGSLASERLAVRSKLWHLEAGATRGDTVDPLKVALHPFKRDYHRQLVEISRFKAMLRDYDSCLTLHFEDILQGDVFQPQAIQTIGDLLGRTLDVETAAQLSKVSPPPSDFIANYDELSDFIAADEALGRIYATLFGAEDDAAVSVPRARGGATAPVSAVI